MLTSVTFILLLCYSAVLCNPHGVFWAIVDKHVTIGHDLNLYCNESSLAAMNCCPKNSTRRWFGGPDRKLLYKNGISFYPLKYTSRLEDGGFYLTIHDVEEKDLNVSYACSVKIYEYTDILPPNYDTAESSFSTEISTSTEPSISGSTTVGWRKGNTNERNDELTFIVIFITTFLVLFIVVSIVGCHKRIKKLLKGIFHSNDASIALQNGTEDINMESDRLLEVVTTTENTDQNNRVEPGIRSISGDDDRLLEVVTTTENTDQNNRVEPGIRSISGDDGISSISGDDDIGSLGRDDGIGSDDEDIGSLGRDDEMCKRVYCGFCNRSTNFDVTLQCRQCKNKCKVGK